MPESLPPINMSSRASDRRTPPEIDWNKLKKFWWLPFLPIIALALPKLPDIVENLQHHSGQTSGKNPGGPNGTHETPPPGHGGGSAGSTDWNAPDAQLHVLEQHGHADMTDDQFWTLFHAHNPNISRSDVDAIHHKIHEAGLDDRWVAANLDFFSHGQWGAGDNTVAHDHNIFDQHPAGGDEVYHDGIDPQGYINFLKEAQDKGDSNPGLDSWLNSIDRMSQLVHERIHNDLGGDDRVVRVEPELFGHPVPTPGLPFTNDSVTATITRDMESYPHE